jgi:hypothetical protein
MRENSACDLLAGTTWFILPPAEDSNSRILGRDPAQARVRCSVRSSRRGGSANGEETCGRIMHLCFVPGDTLVQKLGEATKPTGPLTYESAKFADAIPQGYGPLIDVTQNPKRRLRGIDPAALQYANARELCRRRERHRHPVHPTFQRVCDLIKPTWKLSIVIPNPSTPPNCCLALRSFGFLNC